MGLFKAIKSGKEHRTIKKRGCRRKDGKRCGCEACQNNRQHLLRLERRILKKELKKEEKESVHEQEE